VKIGKKKRVGQYYNHKDRSVAVALLVVVSVFMGFGIHIPYNFATLRQEVSEIIVLEI